MKSSPSKAPEPAVSSWEKELEVSFWKRDDVCVLLSTYRPPSSCMGAAGVGSS